MAHWISKVTGAFPGDGAAPQSFELYCDCGQKHSGVRRQKWQRIICRACGGSLFVLQKDPYPPPKDKPVARSAVPSPALSSQDEAALDDRQESSSHEKSSVEEQDEIFLDDELVDEVPHKSRRANKSKVSASRSANPHSRPEHHTAKPVIQASKRLKPDSSTGFWKPFRLILLAIGVLSVITTFFMFRSNQRKNAERQLAGAVDRIRDTLRDGQWVEARNQLETAVKAFDILGREGDDVKRYRQLLRETTAMTGLLTHPLSELLAEAEKASQSGDTALDQFQFKVKGQWIVIEGQAVKLAALKSRSRVQYAVPIPITIGAENRPVDVVIESSDLARQMSKSESQPVVLAVQVEEFRPSQDGSTWQVIAVPQSTVLWTSPETYVGIGYSSEDVMSVTSILQLQAQSLGVTHVP